MTSMMFVAKVEDPYAAIALLCLGGFAHQTLSITIITMSSDLFRKNEVATVAGIQGLCGNLGVLIFTLMLGGLVKTVGYAPFFVALAVFDILAAIWLWTVVRDRPSAPVSPMWRHPQPVARNDPQSNPAGIQSRSFHPARRRRLLHRDFHLRVVSRCADPSLARPGELEIADPAAAPGIQLNMLGDPDSCGVWAPCLTYSDGLFWLIYTDVKRYGRTTVGGASGASLRDFHNYLVTCPTIDGEW